MGGSVSALVCFSALANYCIYWHNYHHFSMQHAKQTVIKCSVSRKSPRTDPERNSWMQCWFSASRWQWVAANRASGKRSLKSGMEKGGEGGLLAYPSWVSSGGRWEATRAGRRHWTLCPRLAAGAVHSPLLTETGSSSETAGSWCLQTFARREKKKDERN